MPFSFCAAFCATATAAATAADDSIQPRALQLTTSSASDTSTSSDNPSSISTASFDDNISLQTLPSIPSVNSLNPTTTSDSTTFLCLTTINSGGGSAALTFSPTHLYTATESALTFYDLTDLRRVGSIPIPSSTGSVKSIHHDGQTILTAHQDGHVRLWRDRHIATLPTLTDRLLRLPFPSSYVTVRRHKRLLWIEHADTVSAVTARNGLIYSVSWDKTLKVWRASDLRCMESVRAHDDAVNAVAVAEDGTIYTGSADRRIRVWSRVAGDRRHKMVATLEKHSSAVNALALSEDGSVLYSGACDRSILVWEREGNGGGMRVVGALRGHRRAILCLVCVGELVVSGSSDRTVRVWRRGREGYSCVGVMEGHLSAVRSVSAVRVALAEEAVDEEEFRVCSGSVDGEVRVWRVRVGSCKRFESDSE